MRRDHGLSQVLRTDNGPEFLGEIFTQWAKASGMAIQYIHSPATPTRTPTSNASTIPSEKNLDQNLFTRLDKVREGAYWWMLEYNQQRPHESLGNLTPSEYRQQHAESSTSAFCA